MDEYQARLLREFIALDRKYRYAPNSEHEMRKRGLIEEFGIEPLVYNTEELETLTDKLVASEQDEVYIFPLAYVEDPQEMIQRGYWPTSIQTDSKWFYETMILGLPQDVLDFWWAREDDYQPDVFQFLHEETCWVFRSMASWKRLALNTANSSALSLYCPEALYKGSLRPITEAL